MFIWKQILKGNPRLLQIKFTVQGREVVIPLGHDAGDEKDNSTCRTTQHVLVAKDEGLISEIIFFRSHAFMTCMLSFDQVIRIPLLHVHFRGALYCENLCGVLGRLIYSPLCTDAKWGINRPKTPQNHSRQHRKPKVSKLYLSDCH